MRCSATTQSSRGLAHACIYTTTHASTHLHAARNVRARCRVSSMFVCMHACMHCMYIHTHPHICMQPATREAGHHLVKRHQVHLHHPCPCSLLSPAASLRIAVLVYMALSGCPLPALLDLHSRRATGAAKRRPSRCMHMCEYTHTHTHTHTHMHLACPDVRLQARMLNVDTPACGPIAAAQRLKLPASTMLTARCCTACAAAAGCGSTSTRCIGRRCRSSFARHARAAQGPCPAPVLVAGWSSVSVTGPCLGVKSNYCQLTVVS
jgi:hypothetical protein